MILLVLAALSGITGAMLERPDRRLGYAVASAIVALCLGTAIPGATIVDTVVAATITAALPLIAAARPLRAPIPMWWYGLVTVIGAVAALVAGGLDPFASYVMILGAMLGVIAASMNTSEWKAVCVVVVFVAVTFAVVLVMETFVFNALLVEAKPPRTNPFFLGRVRGQATAEHPLVAGFVCVVGMFVTLRSNVRLVVKLMTVAVLIAGVLSTGSSTPIIAGGVGVLGWFLVGRSAKVSVLRIVALIILAVSAVVVSVVPTAFLNDVFGNESTHRLNSLRAIPRLVGERGLAESLFGSGFGSAERLYQRALFDNDGFFAIDNQFVTVLAAAGVVGAVFFLGFLAWIFWLSRAQDRVLLVALSLVFFGFDLLASPVAGPVFLVFVASCVFVRSTPARALTAEGAMQRSSP